MDLILVFTQSQKKHWQIWSLCEDWVMFSKSRTKHPINLRTPFWWSFYWIPHCETNLTSTNKTTIGNKCWIPFKSYLQISTISLYSFILQPSRWTSIPLQGWIRSTISCCSCNPSKFLPALQKVDSIDDDFKSLSCNGVKQAGIGIKDPTTTADVPYSSSWSTMSLFVEAMLQNSQLDLIEHRKMFDKQAQATNNPKLTLNSRCWTQCQNNAVKSLSKDFVVYLDLVLGWQ